MDKDLASYLLLLYQAFLQAYQKAYRETKNPRLRREVEKLRKDIEELRKVVNRKKLKEIETQIRKIEREAN